MYETFEHKADIGIRGKATSVERAFCEAAMAMFSIEGNLKKIKKHKKIKIACKAENLEELFVEWLNQLLAQSSIQQMLFSKFSVQKIKNNKLKGYAYGSKIKKEQELKIEIKAATYSQLKVFFDVKNKKKNWVAQCIVDV